VRGGHRLEVSATRRFFLLMIRGVRTPRLPAAGGASSTPALSTNFGILVQDPRTAVSRQTLDSFETRICGGHDRLAATKCQEGASFFSMHGLATRGMSHCDAGLSRRDTGLVALRRRLVALRRGLVALRRWLVALRHGACRAATLACRAATRGVSRRDTRLSHCDTGMSRCDTGMAIPHLRHLRIRLFISQQARPSPRRTPATPPTTPRYAHWRCRPTPAPARR
jgi:hypothetical protein